MAFTTWPRYEEKRLDWIGTYIEEKTKTEAYGEKIEKPPEPEKETEPEQAQKQADDGLNVLTKLLSNPETAALLKALAKNI